MLKFLFGLNAYIASLNDTATLLAVDSASYNFILANVNFAGDEYFYMLIKDDAGNVEEVKVTNATDGALVIERGTSETTPSNFLNAKGVLSIGKDAIIDTLNEGPAPADLTIESDGPVINVERDGNTVTLQTDNLSFKSDSGINIGGSWPNYYIAVDRSLLTGCCGEDDGSDSSGGGINDLELQGSILSGYIDGTTLHLYTDDLQLNGGSGIEVSGEWPYYTISNSGGGGSNITVAVGAGLTLTGSPTTNPTISISNTGVTPGDYNGVVINARGQITQVPAGFSPISEITSPDGSIEVTESGAGVALSVPAAEIGTAGIVALADDASPLDEDDDTTAVTPKLLAAVMAGQAAPGGSSNGSYTSEIDADYTNILSGSSITLSLAAGQTALIVAQVTAVNNTTPSTAVEYGLALFRASGVKIIGNKKIAQSQQTIIYSVTGPISEAISLATTDITGSTVQSQYLTAIYG